MSVTTVGSSSVGGRPLSNEAVFRIEVSLSSRKSSAIVMRTTARLYTLDQGAQTAQGSKGDAEWKSLAYGVPCIQLTRESTEHNSPFHIKLVIAEVESGISLWETELDQASKYNAMQNNFHTFSAIGKTFAIQFAGNDEAVRMLESIKDLMEQKQKAETVSFEKKPSETIFKKPKSLRRLSKKDISAPCNFKHVSGITLNRTQTCEEELRGTIQRKMRSMSLSNLSRRRVSRDSSMDGHSQYRDLDVSPTTARRAEAGGSLRSARTGSLLHKFGSLRLTKKKPYSTVPVKIKGDIPTRPTAGYPPGAATNGAAQSGFIQDERRQSLPAHIRRQTRPPLANDTFITPGGRTDRQSPMRSFSTDDLPTTSPNSVTQPQRRGATLERRHTIVLDPTSPRRQAINNQFNYTPYAEKQPPYQNGRHHSVTGLNHPSSLQYHHQQQVQQYYRNGTINNNQHGGAPLSSRPYVSDMSLNRNTMGYAHPQMYPVASYGPTAPSRQVHRGETMPDGGGSTNWTPTVMSSSVGQLQMSGVAANGGGVPPPGVRHQMSSTEQLNRSQHPHQGIPTSVHTLNGDVNNSMIMAHAKTNIPPHSMNGAPLQSPTRHQQQQEPISASVPYTTSHGVVPSNVMNVRPNETVISTRAGDDPKPYATVGVGSVITQPRIVSKNGSPQTSSINPAVSSAMAPQISSGSGASHIPPTSMVVANGTVHVGPSHSQLGQNRPRDVVTSTANGSYYDVLNPKSVRNMPLPPTPNQVQVQLPPNQLQMVTTTANPSSPVSTTSPTVVPLQNTNKQPSPPLSSTQMQQQQQQQQGQVTHWSQMASGTALPPSSSYPVFTKAPSPQLRHFQRFTKSTSPSTLRKAAETNVSMVHSHGVSATMQNGHSSSKPKVLSHPIAVKGPVIPQARLEEAARRKEPTRFQPNSTQAYDTLPSGPAAQEDNPGSRDSLADSSTVSLTEELSQYTEQMSKALEQFDSLLQPQTKRQIMQTSL